MKAINWLVLLSAIILVGCSSDNYIIIPSTSNTTNGTVGPPGPTGPAGPAGNNGTDGTNGTSITFTSIYNFGNGSYEWNFSDNTSYITGNLTGAKGNTGSSGSDGTDGTNGINGTDGVSVVNATILSNGSLNVTLSNGSSFVSGNLTGPIGATGPQGPAGTNGTNGVNGTNGINGSNLTFNSIYSFGNGSLEWNFSDGTSYITPNLTGAKGDTGATGATGAAGTNGTNGLNGTNGVNGTNGINGSNASVTGQHPYINVTEGIVDANITAFDARYTLQSNFLSYQALIYTNITALQTSNTTTNTRIDSLNSSKGVANLSFTTISTTSGTSPVADSAIDTLTLTAGSGITITGDSATDTITFTASAGGGNASLTSNGTFGFIPVISSSSALISGNASFASNGNLQLPRNIVLYDYGSDGSVLFNNTAGGGITWIRASDRIRYSCNSAGTGTCELYGGSLYFAGSANPTLSLYSDSVDRTLTVTNTGAKGANLVVDNNLTTDQISVTGISSFGGVRSGNSDFVKYTTSEYATTSNTVYVPMTQLTTELPASSSYIIECNFLTYSAAATTGERLRVNTTNTPTTVVWSFNSQVSATTRTSFQGTSTSTNAFADTGSAGTNVRDITRLQGYIVVGGTATNVTYEMISEISASNAAYAIGSSCQYRKVA